MLKNELATESYSRTGVSLLVNEPVEEDGPNPQKNFEFQVIFKVEAVSSCREVDRRVLTADADAGLGLVILWIEWGRPDDQTVHPTAELRSGLI